MNRSIKAQIPPHSHQTTAMKCSVAVLFLLLAFGLSEADINTARKDALKKIQDCVQEVMKIGSETNGQLNKRQLVVDTIHDQMQKQGKQIKDNNIVEVEDETKSSYTKANVLGSLNPVYGCIALTANDGEISLQNNFYYNFYLPVQNNFAATKDKQKAEITKWANSVNAMTPTYEGQYNNSTLSIYNAKEEASINAVVTKFVNSSTQFKTLITSINGILQKIQLDFFNQTQTGTYTLRTALIQIKNDVFAKIKTCFNAKLLISSGRH